MQATVTQQQTGRNIAYPDLKQTTVQALSAESTCKEALDDVASRAKRNQTWLRVLLCQYYPVDEKVNEKVHPVHWCLEAEALQKLFNEYNQFAVPLRFRRLTYTFCDGAPRDKCIQEASIEIRDADVIVMCDFNVECLCGCHCGVSIWGFQMQVPRGMFYKEAPCGKFHVGIR